MKNFFISKELHSFIVVAEQNSIQKAAGILHLSSPPVCKRIKKLEFELGFKLFVRRGNKMELTERGCFLYEKAKVIKNELVLLADYLK